MPQTIAMHRGVGAVSVGSTGVPVTLFTQSGGIATRVIFNNFAFYCSNTNSNINMVMRVDQSGGGILILTRMQVTGSGGNIPSMGTNGAYQPVGGSSVSGSKIRYQINNNSATYPGTGNPDITSVLVTGDSGAMPQQFWIGPSDAVVINMLNNSGTFTMNYAYSFTTITES
jgi:hypothetical protein